MSVEITNPYVLHVLGEEGFKFKTESKILATYCQELLFGYDFAWKGKDKTVQYDSNTFGLNFVLHFGERLIYRYGNIVEFNNDQDAVVLTIRALNGLWYGEELKLRDNKKNATHFSKSNGRYYLITHANTYYWRDEDQSWRRSKAEVDGLLNMILDPIEDESEVKPSPKENLHVPKTQFNGAW